VIELSHDKLDHHPKNLFTNPSLIARGEMMDLALSNGTQVCLDGFLKDSLSIKGSFHKGCPIYLLFGISSYLLIPYPITWFSSFVLAKEAKTQLDLAMNQVLYETI